MARPSAQNTPICTLTGLSDRNHAANAAPAPCRKYGTQPRWLAFLVAPLSPGGAVLSGTLWLARTDGQDARPVVANAGPFAWSPAADVLAATVTNPATGSAWLCELRPGVPPRRVPGVTGTPAVWSPDGRELAFTGIVSNPETGFTGSALETVPASGGTAVVVARSTADALLLDGWWPDGRGLLAWADPQHSGSIAADGIPLVSYPLAGGRPVTLGATLVHDSFAVASALEQNAVALVAGGDRILWNDGKTIRLCAATGASCSAIPGGPPGPVNLDPAWSPSQEPTLAFVHGAASWPGDFSQQNVEAWYATRKLWAYVQAGNPHLISGAGTGIADPVWSADGTLVLYVRDNGLWVIDPFGGRGNPSPGLPAQTGGPAMRIVSQLFAAPWPNYYAYVDWPSQFAWRSLGAGASG